MAHFEEQLQLIFKFSSDDLLANREGKLSKRQLKLALSDYFQDSWFIFVMYIVVIGIFFDTLSRIIENPYLINTFLTILPLAIGLPVATIYPFYNLQFRGVQFIEGKAEYTTATNELDSPFQWKNWKTWGASLVWIAKRVINLLPLAKNSHSGRLLIESASSDQRMQFPTIFPIDNALLRTHSLRIYYIPSNLKILSVDAL